MMYHKKCYAKRLLSIFLVTILSFLMLYGCQGNKPENKDTKKVTETVTESQQDGEITDYSKTENWAFRPQEVSKEVDVFYLYPTVWARKDKQASYIGEENDPMMLNGAKKVMEEQASVFDEDCDVYMPYYRQIDAAYALGLDEAEHNAVIEETPVKDGLAAFDYYIQHYNQNRPFILAGHSQGSNVLLYLLSDYMKDHPEVQKRMVAAYVVGYSVTDQFLADNPHLKFAEAANDTGVIISYNTQAPGFTGNNPVVLPDANVINPINWKRDETEAPASENIGSRINQDGVMEDVQSLADAKVNIEKGVLECSTVDTKGWGGSSGVFEEGVYHAFDYQFYYYNLQKNVSDRVDAFLQ